MKFPTLYHRAKGGDLREWTIWTEEADIVTQYGQINGKLQISRKRAESKNIGRSNETTPIEQAKLEAEALYKFKLDRKYSETKEAAEEPLLLPMLAHKYEDKKKHVVYSAWIQPKLDGLRCLAMWENDKVILISRSGKPYTMPPVQDQLAKWLPRDTILDGELYRHGMSCQTVTSYVKKWKAGSEQIIYNIYDAPVIDGKDDLTYKERLMGLSIPPSKNIEAVPGFEVANHNEVMQYHGKFLEDGYEGSMLRMYHGLYLWGYRSSELLKIKAFQDAEFKVIGANEGRGKMQGCVIWICQNNNTSGTFECSMKVPMDERARMYREQDKYISRMLTVRYFDLTDDGVPRFPVGIVFRDEADLPLNNV